MILDDNDDNADASAGWGSQRIPLESTVLLLSPCNKLSLWLVPHVYSVGLTVTFGEEIFVVDEKHRLVFVDVVVDELLILLVFDDIIIVIVIVFVDIAAAAADAVTVADWFPAPR